MLTVAALTAAEGVLIPLQCETLSHRGVGQLLDTVHDVRRFTNRDLEVWGVLPTLYDGRTNHARTVLETISETYDLEVIEPPIPKTIKFAEAPAAGRSILATSRSSKGARAYREVAENLHGAQRARGREGYVDEHPPSGGAAPLRPDRRPVDVASPCPPWPRWPGWASSRPARRSAGAAADPAAYTSSDDARHPIRADPDVRTQRPRTTPTDVAGPRSASADGHVDVRGRGRRDGAPGVSGTGRRIVFSQSRQRVWLVDAPSGRRGSAPTSVSGSVTDNLQPGHLRGVLEVALGRRASTTPG